MQDAQKVVDTRISFVKDTLDEVRSKAMEERDRENRAANIILYNVPESLDLQRQDRWKEDRKFGLDMFEVMGLKIREEDFKRFLRLGKL
jgi:hypothetical protein